MLRNNIVEVQKLVKKDGIVFLTYGGFLTQTLISGITEALEKEAEENDLNMGFASNIFTIFIELAQNMMNYSKSLYKGQGSKHEGIIIVGKVSDDVFYIDSHNAVSKQDMHVLDEKMKEIKSLDRDGIKKRYRELRRSGKDQHGKGAGIGFFEIAKRCTEFNYQLVPEENDMYHFYFEATINSNNPKH